MAVLSLILLIVGLVLRLSAKYVNDVRGPAWKTRHAFASQAGFMRYILGTAAIVSGVVLLAVISFMR
ncbi:MAG TPA: hypothetical protein VFX92_02515 [Candidatus Krumholzibacteria bacterium]|nr:hypothetical protein [Candidatus Krumholzibacteria bacterium]